MTIYYAGIGARKTPSDVCATMTQAAKSLEALGWCLRTGGAQGADTGFFDGVAFQQNFEVYIPWEGFQGFTGKDDCTHVFGQMAPSLQSEALNIAEEFHPNWNMVSDNARGLMARNSFQVLGVDLQTPSSCVICWTPNGSGSGGTGQAIRIANAYDIPVIDLGKDSIEQAEEMIQEIIETQG